MINRRNLFAGLASSPAMLLPRPAPAALPPPPDLAPIPMNIAPAEWARRVTEQWRVSMAWIEQTWKEHA